MLEVFLYCQTVAGNFSSGFDRNVYLNTVHFIWNNVVVFDYDLMLYFILISPDMYILIVVQMT